MDEGDLVGGDMTQIRLQGCLVISCMQKRMTTKRKQVASILVKGDTHEALWLQTSDNKSNDGSCHYVNLDI